MSSNNSCYTNFELALSLGLSGGRRGTTPLMYPVRSIPLDICSSNHLWTGARGNFQQHSINTIIFIFIRILSLMLDELCMRRNEEKRRFLAIKKMAVFSLSVFFRSLRSAQQQHKYKAIFVNIDFQDKELSRF